MLKSQSDRVCAVFAADFEPSIGFARGLSEAAEAAQNRMNVSTWGVGPARYLLRDTTQRIIVSIEFRRIVIQTLGFAQWHERRSDFFGIVQSALQKLGVKRLKRVGFQASSFLHLNMTHAELVELMFGSFFLPKAMLLDVCGKPEDTSALLCGAHGNMKLELHIAPLTSDQAVTQFMSTPNLDSFLLEPKLLDSGIKEFRDRIATDCLFVSPDLYRIDVADSDVQPFLGEALEASEAISKACVQHLKSLPAKKA